VRQVLARPAARWNPYRTPLRGVYLCSSATPPGPGVHGRCGELAALTALRDVFGVREPPDLAIPARLPRGGLAGPVGGDVHPVPAGTAVAVAPGPVSGLVEIDLAAGW
jgi:hypothetical protein